jgi:hypothetical protein
MIRKSHKMTRTPRNRFEKLFRQIDFSKLKTNPLPQDPDNGDDMVDDDTKLSPALERHVAAMIVAVPTITRQQAVHYLLHTAGGRALAQHLSSTTKSNTRKETPMTSRADGLRQIAKDFGVHRLAKMLVMENDANGISEHELTSLAFEEAKKHALPGERPNSTFARWYSEPDQLPLRKAIQIAKNTLVSKSAAAPLMVFEPTQVGGDDALDTNTDKSKAYAQLVAMAEAMRAKSPTLTIAQCFARVFEDTANAELAAKAHRRPSATMAYAMPT